MSGDKEYKNKKDWFANNLIAVPAGIVGNCSACVFRNAQEYCAKMSCTYFDNKSDFLETVYWCGGQTHASIGMWSELRNFFDTTPAPKIRDISNKVMCETILEKMQKTR